MSARTWWSPATDTGNGYALWRDGQRISREESEPILREAYAGHSAGWQRATGIRSGGWWC